MQQILTNMWQRLKISVLFVTHDIDEAIFLSDRVYCMTARPGSIKAEIPIPLERPRQQSTGSLEHEELTGHARLHPTPLEAEEDVRADLLRAGDAQELPARAPHYASTPMRSCSESADSARALAIAWTAAAAPEIVVTQGTRATSAASRIR